MNQPDLFPTPPSPAGLSPADISNFRAALISAGCWQTRAQLCQSLGWPDRKVREAAEQLGPEVVRCQAGFKLCDQITREDLDLVKQAIDAFHSQARKMETYAHGLRIRLHALIG